MLNAFGRLTSGMVAISTAVAAVVKHDHVDTVANPVEQPPSRVAESSWSVPRPVVGYLGRITSDKGIEDLLRAAAVIDAHVLVVGEPSVGTPANLDQLRALAQASAPGRVHFVGGVPDS